MIEKPQHLICLTHCSWPGRWWVHHQSMAILSAHPLSLSLIHSHHPQCQFRSPISWHPSVGFELRNQLIPFNAFPTSSCLLQSSLFCCFGFLLLGYTKRDFTCKQALRWLAGLLWHLLLALYIWERLVIAVGFEHKFFASTWPNVWVTFGVLCVHIIRSMDMFPRSAYI
jgi:hypothetical protein